MTNIAKFNVAISELIDVPNANDTQHPYATMARVIFADDKPNGNHQGIKFDEFDNVIKSAIGMPIKMNFTGLGVANHGGSIPIGHIKNLVAGKDGETNQLIADLMLWNEEFPDEIDYLKTAYASGQAPGLSYEIEFKDSSTEDGTQWIKGSTTLGATFVRDPAYGSRTHLLALASLDEEERNTEILALADQIKADKEPEPIIDKGGNLMEEELDTMRAEAATKDSRIAELEAELATKTTETETLTTELETIKTGTMVDARVRQYVEAGFTLEADAEKADKKKSIFASYSDEQWEDYLSDLKAAKATAPVKDKGGEAFASLLSRQSDIPKLDVEENVDNGNLKDAMRLLARPYST